MPTSWSHTLSLLLTVAGLLCLVPALMRRAPWNIAIGMTLDLWTAGGALRLTPENTPWRAFATVALIVVVRHLIMWALRYSAVGAKLSAR